MTISDMKAQMNLIASTMERLSKINEPLARHKIMDEAIEQMEMLRAELHLAQMELEERSDKMLTKALYG